MNQEKLEAAVGDVVDDIPFDGGDEEIIEAPLQAGPYRARLVGFKKEKKPEYKIKQQQERNALEGKPGKFIRPDWYLWPFRITEPGFEADEEGNAYVVVADTDSTFYPTSNGGKLAAYLLGKTALDGTEEIRSSGPLIGRELMLFVTEGKNGKNYASAAKSFPLKAQQPRRSPNGARKPSLVQPDVPADAPWTVDEEDA